VSKCWKQEKNSWKCLGSSSQDSAQSGSTGLSGGASDSVWWCTGQCPVRQAGSCELAALGISSAAYGYNSLDCPVCTGLSGEPTVGRANGRLRNLRKTRGRANGREGAPDCPVCTGQCPVRQRLSGTNVGFATEGKKFAPDSVRCAPGCPVRQATEGKNCLPGMHPTTPSCLGAIKGTPRRMEEYTKHSLSTLDHSHSILAHLFDILVI
jgi:hypothetical protein